MKIVVCMKSWMNKGSLESSISIWSLVDLWLDYLCLSQYLPQRVINSNGHFKRYNLFPMVGYGYATQVGLKWPHEKKGLKREKSLSWVKMGITWRALFCPSWKWPIFFIPKVGIKENTNFSHSVCMCPSCCVLCMVEQGIILNPPSPI